MTEEDELRRDAILMRSDVAELRVENARLRAKVSSEDEAHRVGAKLFAEAFQSLTVKCLGYDAEIAALKRDVRTLQEASHRLLEVHALARTFREMNLLHPK